MTEKKKWKNVNIRLDQRVYDEYERLRVAREKNKMTSVSMTDVIVDALVEQLNKAEGK